MDNRKTITNIANVSALIGLGVFISISSGVIFDQRNEKYIDWRDLAVLGMAGSWMTSWALFRQR